MNSVNLTGRSSKEITLRYTPAGKAVANGTIAVRKSYKNANGEYDSDFINFVAWSKTGELLAEHVKKGEFFGIQGELTTRNYEKDGRRIYLTEVNVTGFDFPQRSKSDGNNTSNHTNTKNKPVNDSQDPFGDAEEVEIDGLPF